MQIRCPHCHEPSEVTDNTSLSDVTCGVCRTHINLISDESTADYSAEEPREIGHFRLIDKLGTGHFGNVWRASDTKLDRTVAIKFPRRGQLDAEEADYFFREARAAAQLKHPGIVAVHEVGRDERTVYIVSDFVQGANLREWLAEKQLTPSEAANVCVKIADALQHAHENGVIHRDLKPGNILMDLDGSPHIADFGLARRETGEVTMTVEGKVLGTPAYMSPEQARGESHLADRRSDIFSLGIILFEMLTAERPFRGQQRMLVVQILTEEPPSPRKLNARVTRDLATICLKCLEKEPQQRYQTAKALADDLRACLDGRPIMARPIGRFQRGWRWAQRNRALAAACAATLLLLTVVAIGSSVAAVLISQSEHETLAALQLAQRNLLQARQAVDEYFTLISEDELLDVPGMQDLRKELLQRALNYHQRFIEQQGDDPELRAEVAAAYLRMSQAYRSIALTDEATDSLEHGITAIDRLVSEGVDLSKIPSLRNGVMRVPYFRYRQSNRSSDPARSMRLTERALELWTLLSERHPDVEGFRHDLAGFHYQHGITHGVKRNPAAAEAAFINARTILEELVEAHPGSGRFRDQLTVAYGAVGAAVAERDPPAAVQIYYDGIKKNPSNPFLYNKLAWLLATDENPDVRNPAEAVSMAQRAVELEPRARNYWNSLGVAHYRNHQWNEAIEALEHAMRLRSGGDIYDWIFLAMALAEAGEPQRALKWYRKVVASPKSLDEGFLPFKSEAERMFSSLPEITLAIPPDRTVDHD